jgi:hypothetical protein
MFGFLGALRLLVLPDVLDGRFSATKVTRQNRFAGDMIEYVIHKFDQLFLCLAVKPPFFVSKNRQHVVILFTVLNLLPQTHRIALDDLPGMQRGFRKDEAIQVESVVSRRVEDESVR